MAVLPTPGLAHVERVVLPPAAEHLDGAVELGLAADERVDAALGGLDVELGAVGLQRVALRARAVFVVAGDAAGARALGGPFARPFLADAVGDEVEHVEAGEPLLLEEEERLRVGLAEERHQHVSGVDDLLLRRQRVRRGAVHDALEAHGGLGVGLDVVGEHLDRGGQELRQPRLQARGLDAAGLEDLEGAGVLQQAQHQVLEGEVLMTGLPRLGEREADGGLQFLGDDGRGQFQGSSGSMVRRSGNSFSSASWWTLLIFVSATSRL